MEESIKDNKEKLLAIAKERISSDDPSHDLSHSLRVLAAAEKMTKEERADLEVVVSAAILHDVVTYQIGDPRNKNHATESAEEAKIILGKMSDFPQEKIDDVAYAISMHNAKEELKILEAKIIQDADNLEITGAIIVMRMFASAGHMGRAFYHLKDPWGEERESDGFKWTLDYYAERLLKVENEMHTESGRKIAKRRTRFLKEYMKELKKELKGE